MMIPLYMAQEMLDEICRLCRRLNPQHADCNWCEFTEPWRRAIKSPTEDATPAAPELLEACEALLAGIEAIEAGEQDWFHYHATMHDARVAIANAKSLTEPAIRTQAQLMQEWGQERFATALGALCNWQYQLAHGDPFSTQEIQALADVNDDALDILAARRLYPDSKPPPDWSTTVKIPIRDVLDWHLHNDKVSWAVTAAAGLAADVPEKYQEWWMATDIEIAGDHFIVHLAAWDADIVP